jgi:hypothetical protein
MPRLPLWFNVRQYAPVVEQANTDRAEASCKVYLSGVGAAPPQNPRFLGICNQPFWLDNTKLALARVTQLPSGDRAVEQLL